MNDVTGNNNKNRMCENVRLKYQVTRQNIELLDNVSILSKTICTSPRLFLTHVSFCATSFVWPESLHEFSSHTFHIKSTLYDFDKIGRFHTNFI